MNEKQEGRIQGTERGRNAGKRPGRGAYRLLMGALTAVLLLGIVMLVLSILVGQGVFVSPGGASV